MQDREFALWERLLASVASTVIPSKCYCAIPGIEGSQYRRKEGLAIIGRAPNGWPAEFKAEEIQTPELRRSLIDRIASVRVCAEDSQMIDGCSYCAPMHWVEHRRRSD